MNEKIKRLEDDKVEKHSIDQRNKVYSEKQQAFENMKRDELKQFINKQRREKVQQEIERVMAKTRLGLAAKQ